MNIETSKEISHINYSSIFKCIKYCNKVYNFSNMISYYYDIINSVFIIEFPNFSIHIDCVKEFSKILYDEIKFFKNVMIDIDDLLENFNNKSNKKYNLKVGQTVNVNMEIIEIQDDYMCLVKPINQKSSDTMLIHYDLLRITNE